MTTVICNDKICIMFNRFFNNKFDFRQFGPKIENSIIKVCLFGNLRLYYFVQALNKTFCKFKCEFELLAGTE